PTDNGKSKLNRGGRQRQMASSEQSSTLLNEVIRIVLVVTGGLLLLSLLGYHSTDPSFNVSTSGEQHNWIGIIGANIASLLFQFFGLASFLLPFIIGLGGWWILKSHGLRIPVLKAIGFLVLIASITALSSELISGTNLDYLQNVHDHSAGGLLGLYLFHFVRSGLHTTGALIVWGTLFVVSLMGVLELSIEESVRRLRGEEGWFGWLHELRARRAEKAEKQVVAKPAVTAPTQPKAGAVQQSAGKAAPAALSDETLNELNITVSDDAKPPVIIKTANTPPGSMDNGATPAASKPVETASQAATRSATPKQVDTNAPTAEVKVPEPEPKRPKIDIKPPTKDIPAVGGEKKAATAQATQTQKREVAATVQKNSTTDSLIQRKPPDKVMEVDDFEPLDDSVAKASAKPEKKRWRSSVKYEVPPPDMLNEPEAVEEAGERELLELAHQLEAKSAEFSVIGHVEHIRPGPVVTTFEFKPDPGVKYSRITGLVDDLCLAMRAESIRIDRIPGKSTVGIEVPNAERATIYLRDVIESKAFQNSKSKLTLALGKTIGGKIYIADLTKMPHLLIAGATGAGKSVGLNSIVMSILFKATPDE